MITAYHHSDGRVRETTVDPDAPFPADAAWLDLLEPTEAERAMVENTLGADLPSREEMVEIESSSRLYQVGSTLYMTVSVIHGSDQPHPETTPVSFVHTPRQVVTVRYAEPRSFRSFPHRLTREPELLDSADLALMGLLDAVVDRVADIMETLGLGLDQISREVFDPSVRRPDYMAILKRIGHAGELTAKARESLLTMARLSAFLTANLKPQPSKPHAGSGSRDSNDIKARIKTLSRDIQSLSDHASFLSDKVNFTLDATLGMVGIDQNNVIKMLSVVATIFVPPTLIASIYGMNFEHMPELSWPFGYPLALIVMLSAAVVPIVYFKRKNWL